MAQQHATINACPLNILTSLKEGVISPHYCIRPLKSLQTWYAQELPRSMLLYSTDSNSFSEAYNKPSDGYDTAKADSVQPSTQCQAWMITVTSYCLLTYKFNATPRSPFHWQVHEGEDYDQHFSLTK